MRPKECRDNGQNDLFKARLDQIVDMGLRSRSWPERSDGGSWRSGSARSIRTSRANRRCRRSSWRALSILKHTQICLTKSFARAFSRTLTISCSAARSSSATRFRSTGRR